ncbi:hypothetical protein [Bradyrhizobium lablabi]|uniref:hypothetical protein n=1 Tax=Bradyrhizobium lablabi TaxID=722472 RepID=UPI0009A7B636|nr:hypothetical protein [Bradyrhizobium lablabi]
MSHQGHRRSGAIDVTRPLPFTALPRPALADLAKDLLRKKDDGVRVIPADDRSAKTPLSLSASGVASSTPG